MSLTSQGWAIRRNNTCLRFYEVQCQSTVGTFLACCPSGFQCPEQDNAACCPVGQANCTDTLLAAATPRCANATWDLFDNDGYFCCEAGSKAYNRSGTDICADSDWNGLVGDKELGRVSKGVDPATFTPSSSTSPTSTSTATTSHDHNTTPIGPIVGGVIGGIAAVLLLIVIAWSLWRRRNRDHVVEPETQKAEYSYMLHEVHGDDARQQLDGRPVVEAAETSKPRELSVNQSPVELPGEEAQRAERRW